VFYSIRRGHLSGKLSGVTAQIVADPIFYPDSRRFILNPIEKHVWEIDWDAHGRHQNNDIPSQRTQLS
jgi:hypothetical protein